MVGFKCLIDLILKHAEHAIVSLNSPENRISPDEMLWFTHTNPYVTWLHSRSSTLWYRSLPQPCDDYHDNVAAAVSTNMAAKYRSFAQFSQKRKEIENSRVLYVRCTSADTILLSSHKTLDGNVVTPAAIMRSLICQALLLDCAEVEDLHSRTLLLLPAQEDILRRGLELDQPIVLSKLLELFGETLNIINSPDAVALDHVESIDSTAGNGFLDALRTLLESGVPKVKFIISGVPNPALESALRGVESIDDNTEYNGM